MERTRRIHLMRAELPSDRDALIAIDGKIFLHPSDQLKYHQEWREVFWILEGNEVGYYMCVSAIQCYMF